jgi:hypothetical protein
LQNQMDPKFRKIRKGSREKSHSHHSHHSPTLSAPEAPWSQPRQVAANAFNAMPCLSSLAELPDTSKLLQAPMQIIHLHSVATNINKLVTSTSHDITRYHTISHVWPVYDLSMTLLWRIYMLYMHLWPIYRMTLLQHCISLKKNVKKNAMADAKASWSQNLSNRAVHVDVQVQWSCCHMLSLDVNMVEG